MTKIVNATWIAARSQPKVFWISGTKSVQEYWMLAAATMQTTPRISCSHRPELDLATGAVAGVGR
ncbi:hypothetical protein OCOJLMKI_5312 [Methylobacterium iners]|uniref:Uncharacterized protein n=1 Tax=Methylobacterium iners TaxID=418707 RepID=A0ABQ4S8F6_9HYPH|nr:hypothetical protein OCOJLMKI_5312 [Methylobacterium iners]